MIAHRDAALVVEQALARVFDPDLVRTLREDSPLSAVGMTDADAVGVADAVADAASVAGWDCRLGDEAFAHATTVADLVTAVQEAASDSGGGE